MDLGLITDEESNKGASSNLDGAFVSVLGSGVGITQTTTHPPSSIQKPPGPPNQLMQPVPRSMIEKVITRGRFG